MQFGGFKQFALGICISYFSSSCCYNKIPKKSNAKEEGFLLAQGLKVQSTVAMAGKAW